MNGMELAECYYETYGRPMIHEKYPEYETRIAVGLVGEGSECFGFDDRISRDHDFGPAFCLWLEKKDYQEIGSRLQKDYEGLPAMMAGRPVRRDNAMTGHRTGVWETGDFYRHFLGRPDVPESVRIKKLVARAAVMSQSGQYNYPRCVNRGEMVAASLALAEFMRHAMEMVYLLNNRYAPFYKWMHRGLGELERLGELQPLFTMLADTKKPEIIEEICGAVAVELNRQGLTRGTDPFLQVHLNEMMSRISEPEIRGLHWLAG